MRKRRSPRSAQNALRKVLSLLIATTMAVTMSMPSPAAIAYAAGAASNEAVPTSNSNTASNSNSETSEDTENTNASNTQEAAAVESVSSANETEVEEPTSSSDEKSASSSKSSSSADAESSSQSEEEEEEAKEAEEEEEEVVYSDGELSYELDNMYEVVVKYTKAAEVPEGSTLSVSKITDKAEEQYYEAKLDATLDLSDDEKRGFTTFLDITIISPSGKEVKPAAAVEVEINIDEREIATGDEYSASAEEMENSLSVVHFDSKGNGEKIDSKPLATAAKSSADTPAIVFETDSFSVFSITSIIREIADWITDYMDVRAYGLAGVTASITKQSGVADLDEERSVMEAYKVSSLGTMLWLNFTTPNLTLGKYESLSYYSIKRGAISEQLTDTEDTDHLKFLSLLTNDGFALVKDSGLRQTTLTATPADGQTVSVSGRAPVDATLSVDDVVEAEKSTYKRALAAYDISINDQFGSFQPEKDSPMTVVIENEELDKFMEKGGTVDVIHIADDGIETTVEATWKDGALTFEADGFSVYVIIDHEGSETIETPRVQFHFLDEEYTEGANGVYTAGPFNFRNKANPSTYQWTQILTDGEDLEMIVNPPNLFVDNGDGTTSEKFFYGWYVVDLESESNIAYTDGRWSGSISYKWTDDPAKVIPETAISITTSGGSLSVGDTISWAINGTSGTGILDEEGVAHVYLAPIYENYYFVNFRMGSLNNAQSALQSELMTRKLAVLGANDSSTVRIGDIVCQGSDPTHQVFVGWQTETMSHAPDIADQYYATVDDEGNEVENPEGAGGYYITLSESDFTNMTYDLYPLFAEARWLYFNTGQSGNGSTYIGATYRLNNDEGAGTYYDTAFFNANTSVRNGYNMAGWYAFANMDNNSTITNLTTPQDVNVNYVNPQGEVKSVTFNMTAQELVHHNGSYNIIAPADNPNIATATADGVTYTLKSSGGIYYLSFGGNDYKLFGVTGGKLYFYRAMDDLTLHANWTMDTETTVRVIVWKQKVTDDKNITKTPVDLLNWLAEDPSRSAANYPYAVKDYDYEIFYVKANALTSAVPSMTSFSGYYVDANGTQHNVNNLNLTTLTNNTPSYLTDFTGFHYSCNDASIVGRPLPDGSSVYNVYYDRDLRAINFYYYGNNNIPDGAQPAYTYTTTTSSSGTQYGIVNDQYMQLSYSNGQWTAPEYHYVYSQDPDGTFGLVGDKYYPLTKTIDTTTSAWTYTTTDYKFSGEATGTTSGANVYYLNNGIYYGTNRSTSWFSTTWYLYSYTSTTGHGTNLYGLVEFSDGNQIYVPLTRNGNNNNSYYYTLPGGEVYNGNRYTATASGTQLSNEPTPRYTLDNTGRKTDNVYPDSSPRYTRNNRTFTETSATTGTLYGLIDASRSIYAQLTRSEVHTYKYTYVDDNGVTRDYTGNRYSRSYEPTGNRVEYTATRYTRSNSTLGTNWGLLTWSGLYGQSFGRNGYSWDDVSSHYWREGTTGNSGTGQTFLDAFIQESNPYNLATRDTPGSSVIYHYRQQLDGFYTTDDRETAYASGGSFSFSNKFTGFTVSTYSTGNNGYSPNGGSNTATGSSSSYPLHIYHTRNAYDFTFDVNYPDDATVTFDGLPADDPNVQKSTNLTVSPKVLYEGPLASYGSTPTSAGTNWYYGVPNEEDGITATHVLKAPDHYSFGGWYEDATCTVPFNFNSTMPAANKIVYAKWEPDWFVIRIDPNGAEIDHINHDAAGSFSRAAIPGERAADSGYNPSQSTYFWLSYAKTISEYSVSRNYAPISDEAAANYDGQIYYYMNHQYSPELDSDWGLNADARNALYLTEDEVHQYYSYYASYAARAGVTVLSEDVWRQYYVSSQKYRICNENETYKFLGWYQVLDAGTENEHLDSMPYVFSTPVSGDVTLRAMWRLDGGYKIQYHADYYMEDGTYINGTMSNWFDPKSGDSNLSYADGAYTTIYKQPFDIMVNGQHSDEYDFRGFRLVSVQEESNGHVVYTPLENNVYYQPGDEYTVLAANADKHGTIHLQAVYEEVDSSYRRPYVTNLTLDANGGYLTDGAGTKLEENRNLTLVSGWSGIGTVAATAFDPDTGISLDPDALIEFGDIQSNQAIHLYRYATELTTIGGLGQAELDPAGTNYFAHPQNFFLLGFDDEPDEGDYIATYAADGVISIARNENETLYAVWEPMIYLNFENNTNSTVTFSLTPSQTGSLVLYVLNQVTGLYDRQEIDPSNLTLEPGEAMHLALPYGEEQGLTISGTNDLGVGKRLIWNTSVTDDETGITYTSKDGDDDETTLYDQTSYTHTHNGDSCVHDLASGSVDSSGNAQFSFDERLLFNSHGMTITFDEDDIGYALVLDDNYPAGGTQEYDYADLVAFDPRSQVLPSTSTRMGYQLLGWAYDKNATTPDYSALLPAGSPWEIADLYDFFRLNPSVEKEYINDGATLQAKLYAVWDINNAASTVYVYKNVPEPGNQNTEFSFEYTMQGTYRASGYSAQNFNESQTFSLAHGEYAVLVSSNRITNAAEIQTIITIYNADGTVKKDASDQNITYTVSWSGTYHAGGGFQNLDLSVTETELPYYDASVTRSAQSTNNFFIYVGNDTTGNVTQADTNTVYWTGTDAGGTVVFTNQRQTHDVIVNKILHSNTSVAGTFAFSASYTIDGETVELPDAQVTSGTPNTTWLEDIPAGAVLTITEANNGEYETVISAANATDEGPADDYSFTFTVNDDDTITFDNTLKSYPVKFRLYNQYGDPLSGMFSMSSATSSLGNQLYADPNNDGIFYQNNHFWVGEYTLNENIIPTGYIGLTEPVSVSITGDPDQPITTDSDMIYISEDPDVSGGYIVTVYNIVPSVEIELTKKLDDPLLDQRTFNFTVGYTYELLDPEGHVMLTINKSNAYPIQATHQGTSETILVPGGATVTAAEVLTAELTQTYDVTHEVDDGGEISGASWTETIPIDELEHTVVFTNKRKTIQVTVQKEAPDFPQSDSYHFNAILDKRATGDNKALANWEIASGYTTNLAGYMMPTGGGATGFALHHGEQIVLTIPYGSCLRVTEDEGDYKTSVALDSAASQETNTIALSATQTRQNHTITFTNSSKGIIAPTDYSANSGPYAVMFVLGLLFAVLAAPPLRGRRKEEGGDRIDE